MRLTRSTCSLGAHFLMVLVAFRVAYQRSIHAPSSRHGPTSVQRAVGSGHAASSPKIPHHPRTIEALVRGGVVSVLGLQASLLISSYASSLQTFYIPCRGCKRLR